MAKKSSNWIIAILLVIIYDIYGIFTRITSGKTVPLIIGILQIFTGNFFGILWLVDLITILLNKKITVLVK
ncbi:MAG: hypothetical protein MJ174_07285 [Treponema sp.]|nr:hypothetical protein [Treponema sp.]